MQSSELRRFHGCGNGSAGCVAPPDAHSTTCHASRSAYHQHRSGVRAMTIALTITVSILLLEIIGGLLTGSLALLADAGHVLTDAAALGLSLGAAWLARRPPTPRRTFGLYRAEILAALVNGTTLLALTLVIVWEALGRLAAPPQVQSGPLLIIALIGLAANLLAGAVLLRADHDNLNVRSAYLHVLGDALGSLGVLLAGGLIALFGWYLADPLLSLAISALLLRSAWRLLRETVDILLEAAPHSLDVNAIRRALAASPGVADVHDLHVWSVASNFVALSGHVRLQRAPSCREHQQTLRDLRRLLRERFGIQHVTLQLEEPTFTEDAAPDASRP
ncbi:cation diffusion facilitator family transporter [Kallotenue papyrolyticum]|uniref:cation diffusion facilitator family transporter n=1 Tax=Kallotenue papyrolyticum TaxID=1325125 RepID=UPI00046F048D|nr:cation diffusion facilitator family transporter [Kallotenue papyrolyticum]